MLLYAGPESVSAAASANQCNADTFPTTAGFEVTCFVTVVNNISATGVTSSTVTTTECLAAAGVPYPSCTLAPTTGGPVTTVVSSTQLVTSVTQCNGIVGGGGSNVICDVTIINNVPIGTSTSGVTVDQCIGSGTGGGTTVTCVPTGSTSGATVTQCNGSATGGGEYNGVGVVCTVSGDAVTAVPLTINQCNGTANGGGSAVVCTTSITNNFTTPPPTTTTTTAPGSTTTTAPGSTTTTAPGSSTTGPGGSTTTGPGGSTTTGSGVVVKFTG